ncbi:hypothetical protein JCM10212_003820 [Sporobolomyces blumeae]
MPPDPSDAQLMPPPPVPSTSKSTKSAPSSSSPSSSSSSLVGTKRRRLACEICRIRRIKCEWKDNREGCMTCATGNYEYEEPTESFKMGNEKRLKKGEVRPDEGLLELEKKLKNFDIGPALPFQMIERVFNHAPLSFPGLPSDYYRLFVKKSAGKSKEREAAAEVLCTAFVAAAATFTDHARIVKPPIVDMPVVVPEGCAYSYETYVPFGARRAEAVLALSFQSRQTFEDSTMRHRPSPESILSIIVMDWMSTLAGEGGEGRSEREYVEVGCRAYRNLMMGKRSGIEEPDLRVLEGPVNAHLFVSLSASSPS